MKTRLGWVICGAPSSNPSGKVSVNSLKLNHLKINNLPIELYERDFHEVNSTKLRVSEENQTWMSIN